MGGSRRRHRAGAQAATPRALRAALAGALGVTAALLVSCSGSGGGLIPAANAGPLRSDFEAVERAAASGNGKCAETEAALSKTQLDFAALPSSINAGLRAKLDEGIANLKVVALKACAQPLPQTNTTPTTTQTTQTTPTTKTPTTPTTPTTTETTPTTKTPPPTTPEGGTPPEETKGGGAEPGGTEPPSKSGGGEEVPK